MILLSKKRQIRIWVEENTNDYLLNYKEENKLKTIGVALDEIVRRQQEDDKDEYSLDYMASVIAKVTSDKVHKDFTETLKKIRLGVNNTDRNTQILIELMNGHMDQQDYEYFLTTDIQESMPLEESKKVVQDRISKQKQNKDSSYNRKD